LLVDIIFCFCSPIYCCHHPLFISLHHLPLFYAAMSGPKTEASPQEVVYLVDVDSLYDQFEFRRTEARTFSGIIVEAPRPQPIPPAPGHARITIRLANQIIEASAPKDRFVGDFLVGLSLFLRLTAFVPDRLHLMVDDKPIPYDSQLGEHRLWNLSGFNEVTLYIGPLCPSTSSLASSEPKH
jgi:hypothetical protein